MVKVRIPVQREYIDLFEHGGCSRAFPPPARGAELPPGRETCDCKVAAVPRRALSAPGAGPAQSEDGVRIIFS